MPLDIPGFNRAFNEAYDRVHDGRTAVDLAAEQEKLRALIPADASDWDRTWTAQLIDEDLPEPPLAPPERSDLYKQAIQIHTEVYPPKGTTEEKIEMLADGTRRIWELAEQATEDEKYSIQDLTEDLYSLEQALRNPPFRLTDEPFPTRDA
ncbi:hypothetical protein [Kribbella shirazensis]|uniref:Acetylornithine deacetylase/succinyl-diaminopimelate desuccinylase-like protein n=1 Tax=Kribbella shirazensis TaxID=1105143 RepID=A0A7X6A2B5_9ACTN|nr:hypothetical protein [Kribbella shirazensis]NIK58054.1 acetylornithine deacetylase/succinyl-diaminopimelate desuccinylase-like protein [Kribbella shirazensis]